MTDLAGYGDESVAFETQGSTSIEVVICCVRLAADARKRGSDDGGSETVFNPEGDAPRPQYGQDEDAEISECMRPMPEDPASPGHWRPGSILSDVVAKQPSALAGYAFGWSFVR